MGTAAGRGASVWNIWLQSVCVFMGLAEGTWLTLADTNCLMTSTLGGITAASYEQQNKRSCFFPRVSLSFGGVRKPKRKIQGQMGCANQTELFPGRDSLGPSVL